MTASSTWQHADPADYNLRIEILEAAWAELAERDSKTFLVLRNDHIVFERYGEDWNADKRHYTASLAKALVGGLSLLLAIDDGLIQADDLACQYIPQWRDDPLKSKITIRQLANHTSGLEDAELTDRDREEILAAGKTLSEHHMELPGWKGAFWRQEPDPFTLARDQAPVAFEPGSHYAYSNTGIGMLSYAVTAALKEAPQSDIRSLLRERIMHPLGIADEEWSIGYDKTFAVDNLPLICSWGGGSFTARAVARIGQLLLHNGEWEGRQLIGPTVVHAALDPSTMPTPDRADNQPWPLSGLGFWLNADGVWPALPRDAFAGAGAGDQTLLVVPSLNLVAVRNGGALDPHKSFGWKAREEFLFNALANARHFQPPYPQSPVIADITWAPIPQISRLAMGGKTRDGSDNWPMTWADDGHLYTAYGDGYGFEPGTATKLGMGFAVIAGGPQDFTGFNIRSGAENSGYGAKGAKSSGLLMLDHTLYLWVRNADSAGQTSRLGFSQDKAKSWQWVDWSFAEFGHPAFITYGQHYAGARDNYVYIVSHDSPSAYVNADSFCLMRAPKDQLRQRESYEFFQRKNANGQPLWTTDITQRGAVFTHQNQCRRSSISYNAGIGRYLWWQQMTVDSSSTDTRFKGGFGLYDAPEPWGPWTTVYFAEEWDVGPGDLGCFPSKWMSENGQTIHLVFAGSDHFAVRRANLILSSK